MINIYGTPWYDAPIPRRWHCCRAWSIGMVGMNHVERCACGALRMNNGSWMDRNARRRNR